MRDPRHLEKKEYLAMAETLEVQREEEQLFDKDWNDPNCYTVEIFDAKHEQVSVDKIVEPLEHLSPEQKDDLKQVMKHYTKLFSGILGVHPHKKITLISCQAQKQSMQGHMQF